MTGYHYSVVYTPARAPLPYLLMLTTYGPLGDVQGIKVKKAFEHELDAQTAAWVLNGGAE